MNPIPSSSLSWRVVALFASALFVALMLIALGLSVPRPANAQDLGLEISKTLSGGSQVQVGQILEFTIRVRNTGDLPLTSLQVVDEFVGEIVAPVGTGPYARPGDPPLSNTTPYTYDGNQTITWDLLGGGQQLAPGETLEIVVRLRAIRPTSDLQVVNRARIERAIRSDGQQSGGGSAEVPAQPAGARMPMTKSLGVPVPVRVGLPITFTIVITNDGAIDITDLPLRDIYNPAALQFVSASPPPSSVNEPSGLLEWADLLDITGRTALRPGESIQVRTVYIALQNVRQSVNQAEVSGARDEYGNTLEASRAEVPIFIVGPEETATATATSEATAVPQEEEEEEEERPTRTAPAVNTATTGATATATSEQITPSATSTTYLETATSVITSTAVAGGSAGGATPVSLPNTGTLPAALPQTSTTGNFNSWMIVLVIMLLIGGGIALRRK
jgi:uncharacterized repeat protein (TIGR01451 family)